MPPSLIRSVREADLEEVRAIYAKEVLEGIASFEIEPPHIEEMRARLHRVQDAKLPYLVSELDGRIAGFAYAVPYDPDLLTDIRSRIRSMWRIGHSAKESAANYWTRW